jgi:hypothetical protein
MINQSQIADNRPCGFGSIRDCSVGAGVAAAAEVRPGTIGMSMLAQTCMVVTFCLVHNMFSSASASASRNHLPIYVHIYIYIYIMYAFPAEAPCIPDRGLQEIRARDVEYFPGDRDASCWKLT